MKEKIKRTRHEYTRQRQEGRKNGVTFATFLSFSLCLSALVVCLLFHSDFSTETFNMSPK